MEYHATFNNYTPTWDKCTGIKNKVYLGTVDWSPSYYTSSIVHFWASLAQSINLAKNSSDHTAFCEWFYCLLR